MLKLLIVTLCLSFVVNIFALESNNQKELKELVTYLAHDKLEGRKPGKNGNYEAQKFLVNYLDKVGADTLGDSFEQEFTIFTQMTKNGENKLSVNNRSLEFEPISYSLSGKINSDQIVFAGYGITLNDSFIQYDDYKGLNVEGKIVAVMTGDPGIGNEKSKFRDPNYVNYRSLFYKIKNAIAHKASAILIVNDPLSLTHYPQDEIVFNDSEGGGARFSIISGRLPVGELNNLSGKDLKLIQTKIAKTQAPSSFVIDSETTISVNLKKNTGRVSNIVGLIPGTDPKLAKEVIVIGGHMDHLGWGGESSMDPHHLKAIHNGADDNASGTAAVALLAKKLIKKPLKRSVAIAFFNAEEMGLLGSQHFVSMWARYEKVYGKMVAMLNLDMIGRYKNDLSIMGLGSSKAFKNISSLSTSLKVNYKKDDIGASDHASFLNQKIPALFMTTGAHEDYHRSTDTSDKINYKALDKILDLSDSLIRSIDSQTVVAFDPTYQVGNGNGRARGYGAHLGCVPQFGQPDSIIGVVCTRASDNSPAMKAGIIPNDILVQIGDIDIKNVYDLAFALKYYRAGDRIEIAWMRSGQKFKKMITLAKSTRH